MDHTLYHFVSPLNFSAGILKFWGHLQDIEIVEDGAKHTLVLYNCRVPQTGEISFTAANAKCSAKLKVKGELYFPTLTAVMAFFFKKIS